MDQHLLRIGDVIAILQVSESAVRRMMSDRVLEFIRIGRSVRFERSAIDRYLNGHRVVAVRFSDPPVAASPDDEHLRELGIKHGLIEP